MERNISLEEISDGKLYGLNDMVKASCNDCKGCSSCCEGMGSSIILDPFDIFRMTSNLGLSFEQLLAAGKIELNVVDGMILPNLKMQEETEKCAFLNEEGRCSIHAHRPGICRIFPLGRVYEDRSFQYILQVHECRKENRTKVKVNKWIDTPDIKKNEQFIIDWHYFVKDIQELMKTADDEAQIKQLSMYILNQFYMTPFDANGDFYEQFNHRYTKIKGILLG
ncbi:MAG: YkgJ family cysteine cluster protein [bacterium]|nr:YkgJ family cysteine cluster protein [bacterium]